MFQTETITEATVNALLENNFSISVGFLLEVFVEWGQKGRRENHLDLHSGAEPFNFVADLNCMLVLLTVFPLLILDYHSELVQRLIQGVGP
jgi:hypothetical protein